MKINFSKFSKSTKASSAKNLSKDIKDINYTCSVVHVGRVLTINDINNNRSSKYTYLNF